MLPIFPDLIERLEFASLAGDDAVDDLAPDGGLRLGASLLHVVANRGLEIVDAGVAVVEDALCDDLGEDALDEVHPGGASEHEMQLEAGMLLQLGLHLGRLMGGVVIINQINVVGLFHGPVDEAEKA